MRNSGMPDADQAACMDSMDLARERELPVIFYDCIAPILMLLVLPFVPRSANKLPSWLRKGQQHLNQRRLWRRADARWIVGGLLRRAGLGGREGLPASQLRRSILWRRCLLRARHHPRSFWARYVFGWRNRATQASFDVGIDSSAPIVTAAEGDGWRIRRSGDLWEVFSHRLAALLLRLEGVRGTWPRAACVHQIQFSQRGAK